MKGKRREPQPKATDVIGTPEKAESSFGCEQYITPELFARLEERIMMNKKNERIDLLLAVHRQLASLAPGYTPDSAFLEEEQSARARETETLLDNIQEVWDDMQNPEENADEFLELLDCLSSFVQLDPLARNKIDARQGVTSDELAMFYKKYLDGSDDLPTQSEILLIITKLKPDFQQSMNEEETAIDAINRRWKKSLKDAKSNFLLSVIDLKIAFPTKDFITGEMLEPLHEMAQGTYDKHDNLLDQARAIIAIALANSSSIRLAPDGSLILTPKNTGLSKSQSLPQRPAV